MALLVDWTDLSGRHTHTEVAEKEVVGYSNYAKNERVMSYGGLPNKSHNLWVGLAVARDVGSRKGGSTTSVSIDYNVGIIFEGT